MKTGKKHCSVTIFHVFNYTFVFSAILEYNYFEIFKTKDRRAKRYSGYKRGQNEAKRVHRRAFRKSSRRGRQKIEFGADLRTTL